MDEHVIEQRFGFHKAALEGSDGTSVQHAALRIQYKAFARYLAEFLPMGRNRELALEDLERASMWSHKALAEGGRLVNDEQIIKEYRAKMIAKAREVHLDAFDPERFLREKEGKFPVDPSDETLE